jgi:D-alanyl-D-alanine carboxypeptidase/D-alanyl-D-alanine-endopeptidase (penicillin-binding protein 4)
MTLRLPTTFFYIVSVCMCMWPAHAQPTHALPISVQEALKTARLPPEALSVVVLPVHAYEARLAYQEGRARNPASLMKLVTTAAALDLLGPAFTWRTPVFLEGQWRDGVWHGENFDGMGCVRGLELAGHGIAGRPRADGTGATPARRMR